MTIEITKIFKESFRNVLEHKLEWLRVISAPLIIWLVGLVILTIAYLWVGVGSMDTLVHYMKGKLPLNEQPFILTLGNIIHYIANIIAMVTLYINGFRYAVLNEGGDRWWTLNLDSRFVKIILYYILIVILATIYILITAGIAIGAHFLIGNVVLTSILGVLFFLLAIYLGTRITLTFLLISIDQNTPLRISWRLMKGNVLRMVGLLLLISFALLLILIAGSIILGLFGWLLYLISPWLTAIPAILFLLFSVVVWFLFWAVPTKALALVYKTFTEGDAF